MDSTGPVKDPTEPVGDPTGSFGGPAGPDGDFTELGCYFGQLAAQSPKRKCEKYTFYKIQKYGLKIREIQERGVLRDRPVQRVLKVCDMGGNS